MNQVLKYFLLAFLVCLSLNIGVCKNYPPISEKEKDKIKKFVEDLYKNWDLINTDKYNESLILKNSPYDWFLVDAKIYLTSQNDPYTKPLDWKKNIDKSIDRNPKVVVYKTTISNWEISNFESDLVSGKYWVTASCKIFKRDSISISEYYKNIKILLRPWVGKHNFVVEELEEIPLRGQIPPMPIKAFYREKVINFHKSIDDLVIPSLLDTIDSFEQELKKENTIDFIPELFTTNEICWDSIQIVIPFYEKEPESAKVTYWANLNDGISTRGKYEVDIEFLGGSVSKFNKVKIEDFPAHCSDSKSLNNIDRNNFGEWVFLVLGGLVLLFIILIYAWKVRTNDQTKKGCTKNEKDIKKLIIKGCMKEVIVILLKKTKSKLPERQNELISLQSRIHSNNKKFDKGIIDSKDHILEENKIRESLLNIVKNLEEQGILEQND